MLIKRKPVFTGLGFAFRSMCHLLLWPYNDCCQMLVRCHI